MSDHADGCAEFRALASVRLDGELDELESARLDRHLGFCDPCVSWMRDADALAKVLSESTSAAPPWSSDGLGRSLRWRLVRATSVGAAAVSAAAIAAFALVQPGGGLSFFASGQTTGPEPLCASCMKKQALTFAMRARSTPRPAEAVVIHSHVMNRLVEP